MTTWMTIDQVVDRLMTTDRNSLFELVWDSYKDQYNVRPKHMYNYTQAELVSWFLSHYRWDVDNQCWESIVPFVYDDEDFLCSN